MGKATDGKPKALSFLGGQPLITWQIAALRASGINRIVIVTGYKAALLEQFGLETVCNTRWEETNMVASLAVASDLLRTHDVIVSYSDILYRPDAPNRLRQASTPIAITFDQNWLELWKARFSDPLQDAETFLTENGRLVDIGRRPRSLRDIEGQYMGLVLFRPQGWLRVEQILSHLSQLEQDQIDMTSLLRRLVAAGESIETIPVDGGWCEVDTESDLRLYESRLAGSCGSISWKHDWRWNERQR
jgi:choline kinase